MKSPWTPLLLLGAISTAGFSQSMFRGNAAHTGEYRAEGPKCFGGVKWVFKTGGWILSSPVCAEGLVFLGSDDKHFYAVDQGSGQQKWKFECGAAIRSTAAVSGGLVFFGSYDGFFYALEAATGKLRWKFEAPGERQFQAPGLHGFFPRAQVIRDFWDFFQSSPVVGQGLVYFGSGNGTFYALDAASGLLKWQFASGDVIHSSPALVDGVVYFGSWDSYLYALDASNGALKWKFKTGEDKKNYNQVGIQSSPAVADGVVYFGCRDSSLYALDAKSGQEKWRFKNGKSWINTSPAIHEGVAYVGSPIPAMFRAIDLQTGTLKYQLDARMLIFSSPAIAGDMAYFGSFSGKLHAVDLKTGRFAWEFQTLAGRKDALGMTAPDGRVDFSKAFQGSFYEDMYRAGERLFSLGSILSSPLVDRGVVYFGSTDGHLYALE